MRLIDRDADAVTELINSAVGFWIGLNPVEVMLTQGPQIAVALTLGIVSGSRPMSMHRLTMFSAACIVRTDTDVTLNAL